MLKWGGIKGLFVEPGEQPAPRPPAPEPVPAETPALLPLEQSVVAEQQDFSAIYANGNVPAAPFTAERMCKLLEGLKQMPVDARRMAVKAMDEADDSWKIEDVLLDVRNKVQVLADYKAYLTNQATSAEQHSKEQLGAREDLETKTTAEIRQQIKQLEQLLEREIAKAAEEKAAIIATGRAAQDASMREKARMDAEILRLQEVTNTFAATETAATPSVKQ